ncbi:hypothetical protein PR048_008839 [Dryococelus australis]|uniref:Uncharacterized protein n=1 Tax=Dryococelus australis TaxID=614101 RepID=A0ABQ9HY94_9NEOP|nr:hypothetical protein PR048_008839 [Dryococelus australis]
MQAHYHFTVAALNEPTYYPHNINHEPAILDVFATNIQVITDMEVKQEMRSGHANVIVILTLPNSRQPYKLLQTDWEKFENPIKEDCPEFKEDEIPDINTEIKGVPKPNYNITMNELEDYWKKWAIKVNCTKSALIIFHKRKDNDTKLHLNNEETIKYLGVHLDEKLTSSNTTPMPQTQPWENSYRDGLWEGTKVGDCLVGPVLVVIITLEHHASWMGLPGTLKTGESSWSNQGTSKPIHIHNSRHSNIHTKIAIHTTP